MIILYTLTLFLSAGLLFIVQPMFARRVLPAIRPGTSAWTDDFNNWLSVVC